MNTDVRYEVWVERRFVACRRACKHCEHNRNGRRLHFAGSHHTVTEALSHVPRGMRLRIRQWWERGHHRHAGYRCVQLRAEFRSGRRR